MKMFDIIAGFPGCTGIVMESLLSGAVNCDAAKWNGFDSRWQCHSTRLMSVKPALQTSSKLSSKFHPPPCISPVNCSSSSSRSNMATTMFLKLCCGNWNREAGWCWQWMLSKKCTHASLMLLPSPDKVNWESGEKFSVAICEICRVVCTLFGCGKTQERSSCELLQNVWIWWRNWWWQCWSLKWP